METAAKIHQTILLLQTKYITCGSRGDWRDSGISAFFWLDGGVSDFGEMWVFPQDSRVAGELAGWWYKHFFLGGMMGSRVSPSGPTYLPGEEFQN